MRNRLSEAIDAYLSTWPPPQARQFTASFRRFVEEGPFAAPTS